MELRQLHSFMTVAKLESFSNAALELGYAQSSITTQIQLLEQELNVRLFERLGRSIALTPEGKKLLPIAQQMLRLSSDAKSINCDTARPSGPLVIGAFESLCVTRLPKLLSEYHSRYPDVDISIRFAGTTEYLRAIRNNTIDIALIIDQMIDSNDLVTAILIPEPIVLLCSPEHPFARRNCIYPEDLSGQPLILTESTCGYRTLFDAIMQQVHVKPRLVVETGNVQAIKQMALSGIGITLLPETAVEEELQQERLVRLNWRGPEILAFTQVLYHKTSGCQRRLKHLSI